jgi:hypothetical protein
MIVNFLNQLQFLWFEIIVAVIPRENDLKVDLARIQDFGVYIPYKVGL